MLMTRPLYWGIIWHEYLYSDMNHPTKGFKVYVCILIMLKSYSKLYITHKLSLS